jgi:hypothetical protein
MKISVEDGSNYFKGLLLLIRKDRKIEQPEVDLMQRIGKILGFERAFCENAIREIQENNYIVDDPPVFSTKDLALMFVKDGLTLAYSDNEFHPLEEQWLRSTSERNGLDTKLFSQVLENITHRKGSSGRMEVEDLSVEY